MEAATTQQQPKPKPSRMALSELVKGRRAKPIRTLLYGVEGIGKSTFAANAPSPIFVGAEDGTDHLDVTRFPMPETWQEVLDAPVAELLVESEEPLSTPVLKRARMVRLMKTAGAILERASQPSIRRMAQMLVDQLCEVMPELKGVSPWHAVGRRRTQDELGQAAYRRIPTDALRRPSD